MAQLKAGAAAADITNTTSQFLFGYPHVERMSEGVHDPLYSTALYLDDGAVRLIFVSNDIIFVPKDMAKRVRDRIAKKTGVPADHIMVTATHTHSGPITVNYLSNEGDPVVPKADPAYLSYLEDGIYRAAVSACEKAEPACLGFAVADGTGVGTNRRDPSGPKDMDVPVLLVKSADSSRVLACMASCCMHPTVLHEDSRLVSGDFPGMARKYLSNHVFFETIPFLYHTGPSGNQSPRHVTKANTFAEAERLGAILGKAIERVLPTIKTAADVTLGAASGFFPLPRREFPSLSAAEAHFKSSVARFERLKAEGAPRQEVRTAECDWFGAEETVSLARARDEGRLARLYEALLPAEIQVFKVGAYAFVGWPCEIFIEYDLALRKEVPNAFVLSCANGELQGYIVTEEAALEGGYEASNALFAPESGKIFVAESLKLLNQLA